VSIFFRPMADPSDALGGATCAPTAAMQDWQALDSLSEIQHATDFARTQQLVAAVESQRPGLELARRASSKDYQKATSGTEPPTGYTGPSCRYPPSPRDAVHLALYYAQEGHAPLFEGSLCRIVEKATELFAALPPVTRINTLSGHHTKLIVVGDLHGQLADLLTIFLENGFPSPDGAQYVFNGDFVDRGEKGVEVITLLLVFKLAFPDSVHLNRGNHECEEVNINFGFLEEVERKYGSPQLFRQFTELFNALPLVTVIDDETLVLHGGLFSCPDVTLEHINAIPKQACDIFSRRFHNRLLTDILWSDPFNGKGRIAGKRGPGTIQFGPDITASFLERNKLKLIIRSHEVPSDNRGAQWLHGGKLITVFSASNYCGAQGNLGGLVVFERKGHPELTEFYAPPLSFVAEQLETEVRQLESVLATAPTLRRVSSVPHPDATTKTALQAVVHHLEDLLRREHPNLLAYYRGCPKATADGCISRKDWRAGLQNVLEVDLHWEQYEAFLLPKDTGDSVNWREFLQRYQMDIPDASANWIGKVREQIHARLVAKDLALSEYYALFDRDGNGVVDATELRQGLSQGLGLEVTREQATEMIAALAPPGKPLDVAAFLEGLQVEYRGASQPEAVQAVLQALEATLAASCHGTLGMFRALDRDHDGKLSAAEIKECLKWLGQQDPAYLPMAENPDLPEMVMRAFDLNGSGTIDLLEFMDNFKPSQRGAAAHAEALVQTIARALFAHRASLRTMFQRLDVTGTGLLDVKSFREGLMSLAVVLDCDVTAAQLELVAEYVDHDHDGTISYQEFLQAFQHKA